MARDLRRIDPPTWLEVPQPVPGSDSTNPTHRLFSVGCCWYATDDGAGGWTMYADGAAETRHRLRISAEHRYERPVIVVLPSRGLFQGLPFCVHQPTSAGGVWSATGWRVTGSIETDPITLTVHPSIDMARHWHGFLRSGWLEDCG